MRILTLLILGILLGCTNSNNNKTLNYDSKDLTNDNKTIENIDFQEFISLLPKVNLPYLIYCENCCDHPEIDNENKLIKKYLPEGSSLVGLVSIKEEFVVVLVTYPADMIIPSIVIYNLNGDKIDEKNFLTNWCGQDFDFLGLQYLLIDNDLMISSIDTSYSFKMDSITNEIIDTANIEVSKKYFYMDKNGKIIEK